jgi:hypothetical protein
MISESWEDTIQPLLAPGSELTIEFGVRFLEEREDGWKRRVIGVCPIS